MTDFVPNKIFDEAKEVRLSDESHPPVYLETILESNGRIILKSLDDKQYSIYNKLTSVWSPFLEPVLGTHCTEGKCWAITYFLSRPLRAHFDYSEFKSHSLSLQELIINFEWLRARGFFCFRSKSQEGHYIPEHVSLSFAYQICEGLKVLHKHGLIHGDVSPQNVIITDSPKWLGDIIPIEKYDIYPVLIDYGNSNVKNTSERPVTSVIGTMPFAAPEILDKKPNDRMDIFSLGCVMTYMCFGKSYKEIDENVCWESSTSRFFRRIVKKCTASYEKRYRSVNAVQRDIVKALRHI